MHPRRPDPLVAPAELLLQGGADTGDFDPATATHSEALELAQEQLAMQLLPGQAALWLGGRFDALAGRPSVVRWRRLLALRDAAAEDQTRARAGTRGGALNGRL